MAQSKISRNKIEAYRTTHYRVGSGSGMFVLRIDQYSSALKACYEASWKKCGVLITAFNPFGQTQSTDENEAAHALLGRHLNTLAFDISEADGVDPIGAWPAEKSYLALGADEGTAPILGERFHQDAVVWIGSNAVPQLLLCR